jgi:hypothetical protein
MDYEKTYQMYKDIGQAKKFEDSPDFHRYTKIQKWFDKVKSKRTGEFYQAEELIRRELVPNDWKPPHVDSGGKPLTYPIKHAITIIQIRAPDGSEWVKTRQMWHGLDLAGNPMPISMDDQELYDDILPIYKVKPEKPGDRDTKYIREVINIEHRIKYTKPFSSETVQELYDMKNGACSLILKDETADIPPYSLRSFEDFKNRPFQELLDFASTPKQKFDTSDTEEHHKQYA